MRPPWAGGSPGRLSPLLPVAAAGYRVALEGRRLAYAIGLRRRHRLPVPVISVGNLTVGGTGKTPAVIALCRRLLEWSLRPAVVSRGFGGEKRRDDILPVHPTDSDWRVVGDEPVLIARSLPGVPVFVGADRVAAARRVLGESRPDVIVLDDGFQHWRLARDFDLVLLDGVDPFGNGHLLPWGPLREPLPALLRADAVVLTKANLAEEASIWSQRLANRLHAPVFRANHRPVRLWDLGGEKGHSLDEIHGRQVVAVSGLARNETFPALLGSLGAQVEAALGFGDHQVYGPDQWAVIRRVFAESGAERIVTTAKDAVKWRTRDLEGLPVWVLEITFEIGAEQERLWRVIRQAVAP